MNIKARLPIRKITLAVILSSFSVTLHCVAVFEGDASLEGLGLDVEPDTEGLLYPHRESGDLPSEAVSSLLLLLALTANDPSAPQATQSNPYALSAADSAALNLAIMIEEARGEYLPEVRQLQAEDLKRMKTFIGSPEFHEIGELIGYPNGFEKGMTLADVQRSYVEEIRSDLLGADSEKLSVYRRAITYQIFSMVDMLEKVSFSSETIDRGFVSDALSDLVILREAIIDQERRTGFRSNSPAVARDSRMRQIKSIILNLGAGNKIIEELTSAVERKNVSDMNEAMYAGLTEAWGVKTFFVQPNFRARCGCALKGTGATYTPLVAPQEGAQYLPYRNLISSSTDQDILNSPNQQNNLMLGDSVTFLGFNWNFYTPGFGIVNAGVGSATSEDLTDWLDYCAQQNPTFWNKPHEQKGCTDGVGGGGRFACNPPPGTGSAQVAFNSTTAVDAGRNSGYVQFQNRNVYLTIGGNDFNTKLYRSQLNMLPVLIPFRHFHVANQLNKAISYIQHQAGTRVTLVGYFPLPSYYPGDVLPFNIESTLKRLGLEKRFDQWFEDANGLSIVKANIKDLPGGRFITASNELLRSAINEALYEHDLTGVTLWDCLSTMKPFDVLEEKNTFCLNLRNDQSWLSQRLLEMNAIFASVAAARQTSMYSLYYSFLDYEAAGRGCWWCGNKIFWNLNPLNPGSDIFGRGKNDSIHPNELGYFAYGATLNSIMKQQNAHVKQTPFKHNDGCYVEPADPAEFAACRALGSTFRLIDGACVDTAPPPPDSGVYAPPVVGNPNAPIIDRPDGATTNPTVEPPPLPGLGDNSLFLLALCFMTGICSF